MSSRIEAEMARFEEEISSTNDKVSDDFKPPPPPPIMPPPMFIPHALQSGNKQNIQTVENDNLATDNNAKDKVEKECTQSGFIDNRSNNSVRNDSIPECQMSNESKLQHNIPNFSTMGSRPSRPIRLGPNLGSQNLRYSSSAPPGSIGPSIGSVNVVPTGSGSINSGPIRPMSMLPSPLSVATNTVGLGSIVGLRPTVPNMIGSNVPQLRSMASVCMGPNLDNTMVNRMPPPMPTFFPPPVLPDFGNTKLQQTVYSAAPVLKKKESDSLNKVSDKTKKQIKEKTKANEKKESKEFQALQSSAKSKVDDRLYEIGPEAGPCVGPQVQPMQHHAYASQPPLYGLSPLAGNPEMTKAASQAPKKKKIIRTAAGQKWDDPTLLEWNPNDYRIFCGDLGNEVTDDTLARIFSRYSSFQKARVVRDKNSKKTKGYGFVSFKDPNDFIRAMREINGKYVGNRPIKLRKSNWRDRNIDVVRKKMKEKKKLGYKV